MGSTPTRVALALRDGGALTVSQLARSLELSRPTVETALRGLEQSGLVTESEGEDGPAAPGRPARTYRFEGQQHCVLGVDVGAHRLRLVLADLGGRVVDVSTRATDAQDGRRTSVDELVTAITELLEAHPGTPLRAICVAVPGTVGRDGRMITSPILPHWLGHNIAAQLEDATGVDVELENDALLAALADRTCGAAVEANDAVHVFVGRRLSVALTINGRAHVGVNRTAGAVAHLFGDRIDELGQPRWGSDQDGVVVAQQAVRGDAAAKAEMDAFIADLGGGIASLVLALNPDTVVLGGAIGAGLQPWAPELTRRVTARLNVPSQVNILCSPLRSEAVVLGATLQAAQRATSSLLGESVGPGRLQLPNLD